MKNQKGFALVVTLLVSALLVALVVEFITDVYVDTTTRQSYVDGQRASMLAESGVEGGKRLLQLTLTAQKDYTTLRDQWAKPIEFPDESGNLRVTMEEENSKLNLNYVAGPNGEFNHFYSDPAGRLFSGLKLPADDLLDALADWLDSNDLPKPGGAESAYYLTRKPSYTQSNTALLTLDELAMVKGFDAKTFPKVSPFVTVYADYADAYVNINTAPKEVLMALDGRITDSLAESIIDYRKVTPFKTRGDLTKVAGMDSTIVSSINITLRTKGSIYRIRSEATVNGTSRIIESVVNLSVVTSPKILYWREY